MHHIPYDLPAFRVRCWTCVSSAGAASCRTGSSCVLAVCRTSLTSPLPPAGQVLDMREFRRRRKLYDRLKYNHQYFMALRGDTIVDATEKGNDSRFINHSCEPNSETQKVCGMTSWVVMSADGCSGVGGWRTIWSVGLSLPVVTMWGLGEICRCGPCRDWDWVR